MRSACRRWAVPISGDSETLKAVIKIGGGMGEHGMEGVDDLWRGGGGGGGGMWNDT